jgi:hypothetical protein
MAVEWDLKPGDQILRTELHARFGGRRQGGIGPSSVSANVFIFSDPARGERHGYYDGWFSDGSFQYTGEGQKADQEMNQGNLAILKHKEKGNALRVFDGAGGLVTYVDEFEIDANQPYKLADAQESAPGTKGQLRQVIVFCLRPTTIEAEPATSSLAKVLDDPQMKLVPIEKQHTERAYVEPNGEPYEAERREQKLVTKLEDHLRALGHKIGRNQIVPPGEIRPLLTDLYDSTLGMVVEAKGTVERNAIRMAIGQLLDYSRFVEGGAPKYRAVLVPRRPREDLCDLLSVAGIEVIYPTDGGFEDSTGGALVGK